MGIGESDTEPKRLISVSFRRPEAVIDSTIHVFLRAYGGGVGAEVFSFEDFRYDGRIIKGGYNFGERNRGEVLSNMCSSSREGLPYTSPPHYTLIDRLEKENDARVEYHFLEDCREFSGILQEFRDRITFLKRIR